MARGSRADARPVSGIVLIDKPEGLTSNRVLQRTKHLFRARKAGHTGTLDPIATGMLPVCLGAATRVSGLMLGASKRYQVTAEFGVATDTGDADGAVIERREAQVLGPEDLEPVILRFVGKIQQTPPMYSALKQGGRRLYELAREGKDVPRAPRDIEIFQISVEAVDWPRLMLHVHCSKGTYIRSLISDLAAAFGALAHVKALRRVAVGPYRESMMVSLEALERAAEVSLEALDSCLLPIDSALGDRPTISVGAADALALRQGRSIRVNSPGEAASVRVYDPVGTLVGLGELSDTGELKPSRIFPV